MGAYIGWHCPQNAKGHVLGHVKDLGNDPHDPATRTYTSREVMQRTYGQHNIECE